MMESLVISYKRHELIPAGATPAGYSAPNSQTFDDWLEDGRKLNMIDKWKNFAIGDWLLQGVNRFGEVCYSAIDESTWGSYHKLTKLVWVARNVPQQNRDLRLTWTHHHQVASLPVDQQAEWLATAVDEDMTADELRQAIARTRPEPPLLTAPEPDEAPFNHVTRWDVPAEERTPVDEYEQQPSEAPTLIYPAQPEVLLHTNGNGMAVHYSSDSPEHYTPLVIIDAALTCLSKIDLDPCSNSKDTPNVPAYRHYTAADDGLARPWAGRVYMNPPYGREIGAWVEKLTQSYVAGDVTAAIALVPARTDTQWFAMLRDFPVCFVTGRLTFIGNDDPAPFPSAVFYLGDDIAAFYYAFGSLGDIWQRIEPGMFGE